METNLKLSRGAPLPYGNMPRYGGVNFALYALADSVKLCLFDASGKRLIQEISLDSVMNRTGDVWHILVEGLPAHGCYGYKIDNRENILLDPFTRGDNSRKEWLPRDPYHPLGVITEKKNFDWNNDVAPRIPINDLVIYEMHVRGFTRHPSSQVEHKGKFLGLIDKIPYLLQLGINAIELLPVHEFNEGEYNGTNPLNGERLCNYWGYSTVNFFSPMNRYVVTNEINEFKQMVKAMHENGIEVILDVVFNHTAEGNELGPTLSFRGLANEIYYMVDPLGHYLNFTGCGNTVNCNHPVVREMIIKSLRYWVTEMHVDGFRFDLASIMMRDTDGTPRDKSPLSDDLSRDPVLSHVKLIAEPWDAVGLYHVGRFFPQEDRWSEWNGKYRDTVRRFIKGVPNQKGKFASCLCGSQDIYVASSPLSSINFITCHDGFTLRDLVSYNEKHNEANGEENRDGSNQNDSWNCGHEGPTDDAAITKLRDKQMRNFHLALMVSQGIPMLLMGDEYGHTKGGNNNTWCQDNDLNWFLWDELEKNRDFFEFYSGLIKLRKEHKVLRRTAFLEEKDVVWLTDWDKNDHFVAYVLLDIEKGEDLLIAFNAKQEEQELQLPEGQWSVVVNTGDRGLSDGKVVMEGFSALLLKKKL